MGTVEAIGGCERIVKTTVPASYSRHTSRFLRWIAVPGVSHALLTLGEGGRDWNSNSGPRACWSGFQILALIDPTSLLQKKTPSPPCCYPPAFHPHSSLLGSVWCFTLPIVLVDLLHWRMIPLVIIISWALYVIEEVGHLIEVCHRI